MLDKNADKHKPQELALMRAKLEADIGFLTERLTRMQQQGNPNAAVLATYQDMLESRQQVLQRLDDMLGKQEHCA